MGGASRTPQRRVRGACPRARSPGASPSLGTSQPPGRAPESQHECPVSVRHNDSCELRGWAGSRTRTGRFASFGAVLRRGLAPLPGAASPAEMGFRHSLSLPAIPLGPSPRPWQLRARGVTAGTSLRTVRTGEGAEGGGARLDWKAGVLGQEQIPSSNPTVLRPQGWSKGERTLVK